MKKTLIFIAVIMTVFLSSCNIIDAPDSTITKEEAIQIVSEIMESNGFNIEVTRDGQRYFLEINNNLNVILSISTSEDFPGTLFYRIYISEKFPIDKSKPKTYILEENPVIFEIYNEISGKIFNNENILKFEKTFIDMCNADLQRNDLEFKSRSERYEKKGDLFYSYIYNYSLVGYLSNTTDLYPEISISINGIVK